MAPARQPAARHQKRRVRILGADGELRRTIETRLSSREDVLVVDTTEAHEDVTLIVCEGPRMPIVPATTRNATIPTLCITRDVPPERITTILETGVLGQLPWPIETSTLVAWLRWAERRGRANHARTVGRGLELDVATQRAYWKARAIPLPPREFDVLAHLAAYEGRTVPRRSIVDAVWQGTLPTTSRALDVRISRLRSALGDVAEGGDVPRIDTVPGIGYRLVVRNGI